MRRVLAAAMFAMMLLSPLAADAKILVVSTRASDAGGLPQAQFSVKRLEQLFIQICDRAGVEYKMTNARGTKTLWAATGTQVWGSGAGAWTEQFDAVVYLGFLGTSAGVWTTANGGAATCRPESMTIGGNSGKAPTVPQLFVIAGTGGMPPTAEDAAACTTGVKAVSGFSGRGMWLSTDHSLRAIYANLFDPVMANSSRPAGGWRALIGNSTMSHDYVAGVAFGPDGAGANCTFCDSISLPAAVDTVAMWERRMTHISIANGAPFNASPIVVVSVMNDGLTVYDSTSTANSVIMQPDLEGNPILIMAALARLDSLTGGRVFTDKNKLPIKLGVTVDGGFAHNGRMHPRGSAQDDSAVVISTLDSIAAYNALSNRPKIKITLGSNIDSVDAYANEKAWWSRLNPYIRYSPQSWVAIADSTKGGGVASFSNPRDPLGRFRVRAALGDTSTWEGADSTTFKLLRGSLYKTGVLFGQDRVSRLLMPADDDWSPKNSSDDGMRLADSTVFAISRAGFSAIRVNCGDGDCDPNYLRGNHKGFFNRQQRYMSSVRNTPINILAYYGYGLGGGEKQVIKIGADTTTTPAWWPKIVRENVRATNGLFYDGVTDYEWSPYDYGYPGAGTGVQNLRRWSGVHFNAKDFLFINQYKSNLYRLSVSDFSGSATRPARVGWWTLKSVANSMAMINRLAGRTIIDFAWPEDISP